MSKETKEYILRKGYKHSTGILEGSQMEIVGDGIKTVALTELQYNAFKDKFVLGSEAVEEGETEEQESAPVPPVKPATSATPAKSK